MSQKRMEIYSLFSEDLQDYPYYPFVASNPEEALKKFIKFCNNRDSVCPGAVLHCIGYCTVENHEILTGSIQPYLIPLEIKFKGNLISKIYIINTYITQKLERYLNKVGMKLLEGVLNKWNKNKLNKNKLKRNSKDV